jgi:ubiquinone/menaquinone biosynthesis C-methylase UbiE
MNPGNEEQAYSYHNPRYDEISAWKAEKINLILKNNHVSPKSICEIGCGAGEVLFSLANHFEDDVVFTGYESEQEAFEICQSKEKSNIHYYDKNLLKEDAYFDVVLAIDVFTKVLDYLGFLSQLRLKGEYKVFHIPLEISVYSVLRSSAFQKKKSASKVLHYFNKDTALGTLKGTGYEIIDYFYTSGALELPHRGHVENLWKLPRKLLYAINKDFGVKMLGGFSLMVLTK